MYNHISTDQSVVGNRFHARQMVETPNTVVSAAIVADMIGFVYDESDTLGWGINNGNWWAVIRANSTNHDVVDTGLSRSTPFWQSVTVIPTGVATAECVVATALNGGASYTVQASRTVTIASSELQCHFCIAKTDGTTAKNTNMGYIRPHAWRMNSLDPQTLAL